jgi:hypothetical protein
MQFFAILILLFLYFAPFIAAADTNAWKSRSIYFVLTDRIARSSSDAGGASIWETTVAARSAGLSQSLTISRA